MRKIEELVKAEENLNTQRKEAQKNKKKINADLVQAVDKLRPITQIEDEDSIEDVDQQLKEKAIIKKEKDRLLKDLNKKKKED